MNADAARLVRWIRRARPPRATLGRALAAHVTAALTSVALLVGAVALLVRSAQHPGLAAVAPTLIVIELFAFLRSPIRYRERLATHQLGFTAVTRWRRWLVATVGRWDYTRWRRYATGDLLERSLRDTDELQDLWLRAVVPGAGVALTLVVGDLVIGLLAPHGGWWPLAGALAGVQAGAVVILSRAFTSLVDADRAVRERRALYRAAVLEQSTAGPELSLLHGAALLAARAAQAADALASAERRLEWRRAAVGVTGVLAALVTLILVGALRPTSSTLWYVVASLLALVTYDGVATLRGALETAVAVSAAAERLEQLDGEGPAGARPWPANATLRARDLAVCEDGPLVAGVTLEVAPGTRLALTGPSGVGKSTLLRALAGLDDACAGTVLVGDTPLREIEEGQLRRHLVYVPAEVGLTRGYAMDVVRLGREGSRDLAEDLARLELGVAPTSRLGELSRGERQRLAVVRALAGDPQVVLLDEPTSGLGADDTAAVLALLAASGATVVVATHDPLVLAWCGESLALRDAAAPRPR
ncbi:MAG: ATP-binding cassette domain-containing protein [Acidimicrobiales bacterium]